MPWWRRRTRRRRSNLKHPGVTTKANTGLYTGEQINRLFRSSDLNGKGKLSKKEVEKAFARLGSRWPKYRAWRGRIHADADKDGFISLGAELDLLVDYTLKLGYHEDTIS